MKQTDDDKRKHKIRFLGFDNHMMRNNLGEIVKRREPIKREKCTQNKRREITKAQNLILFIKICITLINICSIYYVTGSLIKEITFHKKNF